MKYQIPEHGCGRCVWWQYKSTDGWGRCVLYDKEAWFMLAPCPEYEMNPSAKEEIEVDQEQ